MSEHIIREEFLEKHEKKLIAKNRGIKNYQNVSEDKLLNAIVESGRIKKKSSQQGLTKIEKITNLSHNELEQITKMNDLIQN